MVIENTEHVVPELFLESSELEEKLKMAWNSISQNILAESKTFTVTVSSAFSFK